MTPEFIVYTDGASRKDGRGGWGYSIWYDECWWDDCGGEHDTTNNRMELMGAISALELISTMREGDERFAIQLWADSQYVLYGITEYIDGWRFRNWRTSGNKPVKNRDLWERLYILNAAHDIDWQWVKGHTGDEGNERADKLAGKGIPERREGQEAPNPRGACLPRRRRPVSRADSDDPTEGWGSR